MRTAIDREAAPLPRLKPGDRRRYVRKDGRLGLELVVLDAPVNEHGEQRLVLARLADAPEASGEWYMREKLAPAVAVGDLVKHLGQGLRMRVVEVGVRDGRPAALVRPASFGLDAITPGWLPLDDLAVVLEAAR